LKGKGKMNFFQDLKQVLEKGMGQVGNQVFDISKLKNLLNGEKDQIQNLYTRLGQLVFAEWKEKGKIEVAGEIEQVLRMVQAGNQQMTELEKRIDLQTQASTAFSPTRTYFEPTQQTPPPPLTATSVVNEAKPVAVVYLCPFCAHQVKQEDSSCSNCQARFY
jgi:hypothetical protein